MGRGLSGEQIRLDLNVIETVQSDEVVRWDGRRLYVEQDVFHNGQLVHRKYRKTISREVAKALAELLDAPTPNS